MGSRTAKELLGEILRLLKHTPTIGSFPCLSNLNRLRVWHKVNRESLHHLLSLPYNPFLLIFAQFVVDFVDIILPADSREVDVKLANMAESCELGVTSFD